MSLADLSGEQDWELPAFDVFAFAPRKTDYCICIPIINEGERIRKQLSLMKELSLSAAADILILDGGSTDGSTDHDFLRENGVRTLLVKTGAGKLGAQLRMGYAYALREGYAGIVTIDGNNKDNPDAIPKFIELLEAGYDYVQGSRFLPGGQAINTPALRYVAIRLLHAPLISLGAGFRFTDTTNGFRGYSRKLLLDSRVKPFRDVFATYELLAYLSVRAPRIGARVTETPVVRKYPANESTPTKIKGIQGYIKLLRVVFSAITGRYNP